MRTLLIILAALVVGGVVVINAENALPGSALYGVKVGFNENIRASVAASTEARAKVNAMLAERRLEEGEAVAVRATLDAEARAAVSGNFERFADRVQVLLAELEAKGNVSDAHEVAVQFEAALRAHEQILARLAPQATGSERAEIEGLGARVKSEAQQTTDIRARLEEKVTAAADVKAAAEGKRGAAENKIREVRGFIGRIRARLGAAATTAAEARLAVAEETVVGGNAKMEAQSYAEAFALFSAAHRIAREAQLLASSRLELKVNIDVNAEEAAKDAREEASERREDAEGSRKEGTEVIVEGEGTVEIEVK